MKPLKRILILEQQDIIIWGLKYLIKEQFTDAFVSSAHCVAGGKKILEKTNFDLLILDSKILNGNSADAINALKQAQSELSILLYTELNEEDNALECIAAGANGFLLKRSPINMTIEAIRIMLNGFNYFNTAVSRIISKRLNDQDDKHRNLNNHRLTNREIEVIKLLLQGKWTKEIADELGLKLTTVSTHKGRIFEKLEVSNSIELYKMTQKKIPELLEVLS